MTHIPKLKRKDIKKADHFISGSKRLFDFISLNLKNVIFVVTAILLPVIIVGGIINFRQRNKKESLKEFYALINIEEKDQKEKIIPKEKLENIIKKYPKSPGAQYAQVYLAQEYFNEKQFEKALELYQDTASNLSADNTIFYNRVWEGIGFSLEATGKYREAIQIYEKLLQEKNTLIKNNLYVSLARCYEELKENSSAVENYIKVITLFPKHPQKEWFEERIEKLKSVS